MGKILKIALLCAAVIALGISIREILPKSKFACSAADIQQAPEAPDPSAQTPEPKPPSRNYTPKIEGAESYDFSDTTSWNLTVSAWEKLAEKDYAGVRAYARKCFELYEASAMDMAAKMTRFASPGREDDFALVNDVAAAHYVLGEAYMKEAKYADAIKEFELIISRYPFAQYWDPKGWFWKVAQISKINIEKIEKRNSKE